jgi:hypothetical protein
MLPSWLRDAAQRLAGVSRTGRFIIGAVVVVMVAVEVAVIWLMFMDPKQLLHLVALHIWCNSIVGAC